MSVNVTTNLEETSLTEQRKGATSYFDSENPSVVYTPHDPLLTRLENDPLVEFYLSLVNPQLLSSKLKDESLFDCYEIVKHLKGEELLRVLDFDIWIYDRHNSSWELSSDRVAHWISAWRAISPKHCANQIFNLPEEILVPLLKSVIDVNAIGIGPEPESDDWTLTPDKRFLYKFKLVDEFDKQEIYMELIKDLYEEDFVYAGSIFSHLSMLEAAEYIELALRWRNARMEESGFPLQETSLNFLKAKNIPIFEKEIFNEVKNLKEEKNLFSNSFPTVYESLENKIDSSLLSDSSFFKLMQSLAANDQDDFKLLAQFQKSEYQAELHSNVKFKSKVLNFLVKDFCHKYSDLLNPLVPKISPENHEKLIYRLLKLLNESASNAIIEELKNQFIYTVNCVKIFVENYESLPIEKCHSFVISTINLGLELLGHHQSLHRGGVDVNKLLLKIIEANGFSKIFQLGWSKLVELRYHFVLKVLNKENIQQDKGFDFDGFNLKSVVENNKINKLIKIISPFIQDSHPSFQHACEGFLSPFPTLSSTILSNNNKVVGTYLEISNLEELQLAEKFVENISLNKDL